MLFNVKFDVNEFRWRKHELVRLEHVYTCPLDQSQGNVRRKVETYWVQRCVSGKRREFGQGGVRVEVAVFTAGLNLKRRKLFFFPP